VHQLGSERAAWSGNGIIRFSKVVETVADPSARKMEDLLADALLLAFLLLESFDLLVKRLYGFLCK